MKKAMVVWKETEKKEEMEREAIGRSGGVERVKQKKDGKRMRHK